MFPNLLTVVGVPAVGGFAAWVVAKLVEPRHMLKGVRASPSGSADLDGVRESLARHADMVGLELGVERLDRLADLIVGEPVASRKQVLKDAKALLRDLAFGKEPRQIAQ